jgi:Family of unknown function (DUF5675)
VNLLLVRGPQDPNSTPGNLAVDGIYQCRTLEPSRQSANPPIPAGKYPISLRPSPKFQKIAERDPWFDSYCDQMPHIDYKPGSVTMIHVGNTPDQTEDCVLVGQTRASDALGNSRAAFAALFIAIQAGVKNGGCWIEIQDASGNHDNVQQATEEA